MAVLKKGDRMPDFKVSTATKEDTTLKELCAGKPTFLAVLRYIGCTVCRYDVHVMEERYDEFVKKGAQVLFVMQSTPEMVKKDLKEHALPFEIICDPNYEIYNALEIAAAKSMAELAPPEVMEALMAKGKAAGEAGFAHGEYEGIEEQLPATFLIGADGVVKYAHYGKNIMDKPDVDEMLAMV
ncbi:Thiol-disulfide oxidoreductase ResA [bioreactor metagenome]|uniref:Thiol-disulfide oxidoreductase ResA n=1 Tax=bioreactor metagenome TaxID=1076179 RepID=A0A645BA65_9ZZZZ